MNIKPFNQSFWNVFKNKYIRFRIFRMVSTIHRIMRLKAVSWKRLTIDFLSRNHYNKVIRFILERCQDTSSLKSLSLRTPPRMDIGSLSYFYKSNRDLDLFILLQQHQQNTMVTTAAYGNSQRVITTTLSSSLIFDYCCCSGSLEIVQYIHQFGYSASVDAIRNAVNCNSFELVKFLTVNRTEGANQSALDDAVSLGNTEIAIYLTKNFPGTCQMNPHKHFQSAAANGHVSMVQYLETMAVQWDCEHGIDSASANGHLPMVQYLYSKIKNRFNRKTFQRWVALAVQKGHVDIIKFFIECGMEIDRQSWDITHLFLNKIINDIENTIKENVNSPNYCHFKLLQFVKNINNINNNSSSDDSSKSNCIFNISIERCNLGDIVLTDSLELLEKYYVDVLKTNTPVLPLKLEFLRSTVQRGNLSILKFLYQNNLCEDISRMLPVATGYEHIDILEYIIEQMITIERNNNKSNNNNDNDNCCNNYSHKVVVDLSFQEAIKQDLYQIMPILFKNYSSLFSLKQYLPLIKFHEPLDIIWWVEKEFRIKDLLNYNEDELC